MVQVTKTAPKLHFGIAAAQLAELCKIIDEGGEVDDVMIAMFQETGEALSASVDRRQAFADALKAAIETTKAHKKTVDAYQKQLERAQTKLKEITKQVMELHPDLPYKNSLGKKLSIVKNSKPSVKYDFELTYKSVRNIILPPHSNEIDPEYIMTEDVHTLDTGKVLADLEAGKELPWASLIQGTNLRGL
jgi:chaperonin cofactor prefoldin